MGHVLRLRYWRLPCCLSGRGPQNPWGIKRALPRVHAAPNSQRRGPKHPDGRPLAELPGGGPAALLMQTARGGNPRTPRGRLAHHFLGTWSPT